MGVGGRFLILLRILPANSICAQCRNFLGTRSKRAPCLTPRGMGTLSDLYDLNTMPPELHRARAVAAHRACPRSRFEAGFKTDSFKSRHKRKGAENQVFGA